MAERIFTICAWCGYVVQWGTTQTVSHGICTACSKEMLTERCGDVWDMWRDTGGEG